MNLFRWLRPVQEPVEVVVLHQVPGLARLAKAIEYAADRDYAARIREARLRRPDLTPMKAPKSENVNPPEWDAWATANEELYDELEIQHLKWAYDILRGVTKVSEQERRDAVVLYTNAQQAGYELPVVDARKASPAEPS